MDREKSSFVLGVALLAVGIVILMVVLVTVLGLVARPGSFLTDQLGGGAGTAPRAFFGWASANTTVTFQDLSSSGSAAIASRTWDLGDGQTSTDRDPVHTYAADGDYFVRLTVRDADGREAVAAARVAVSAGNTNGGTAEAAPGGFDFAEIMIPVGIAVLTTGLYVVAFLVGASLVKAGWNLIRPRPETIRIRLKPHHLEQMATAEVVAPPPAAPPAPSALPASETAPPVPAPPPPES